MQFDSWVPVLDFCSDGHRIETYSKQNPFISNDCKYVRIVVVVGGGSSRFIFGNSSLFNKP
jgi:hypothetical protein